MMWTVEHAIEAEVNLNLYKASHFPDKSEQDLDLLFNGD